MLIDNVGFVGMVMNYAFSLALIGSTGLVFFYLWRKGKLGMDEEAKWHVFEAEKDER